MIPIVILVVVLLAAVAVGMVYQRRAGRVRMVGASADSPDALRQLLLDAGVSVTGATVLHFSADWCGPCAAVRRVVGRVIETVGDATVELEVDIDQNPGLAKALGVLSLPTTFIFDKDLANRARIAGVPSAHELESALRELADHP